VPSRARAAEASPVQSVRDSFGRTVSRIVFAAFESRPVLTTQTPGRAKIEALQHSKLL
jgi:hypothetical protein